MKLIIILKDKDKTIQWVIEEMNEEKFEDKSCVRQIEKLKNLHEDEATKQKN